MAVPEEIRSVIRPRNTVVNDNGTDGPHRYSVRERDGTQYVAGGNPQPRNGRVIGHIINGRYIPLKENTAEHGPEMLSYGASALVKSVLCDVFDDLLDVYPANDAFAVIAMATLKVIKPSITANRMSQDYNLSFVCKDYPGAALSRNSVCTLLQKLGQDGVKRFQFYQKRMIKVAEDHHIAIDGTLKQKSSSVDDLSAFSYKGRIKGHREVSVLYAYDIDLMEPICAQVFPGNSNDAGSYKSFIRDNDIRRGIIINDKGFSPSSMKDELALRPNLHFMTPIKRNDKRIASNNMLDFVEVLIGVGNHVLYNKCSLKNGRFLYAFKDTKRAASAEATYLSTAETSGRLDAAEYTAKKAAFGVIVFESDLDMSPQTAYLCYDDRRLLDLVFDHYKSDLCLDQTNIQGDFSVIGSEFVNFISTVAACRIIRKTRMVGLLDKMSLGDLLDDLSSAWRLVDAPKVPASDDGYWVHTLKPVFEELEVLGLSAPPPKSTPKKRGRPKKNPVPCSQPKRPRGRPRKTGSDSTAGI